MKIRPELIIVAGVGDTIRGSAMDFVDSATGTANRRHPETDAGQQKVERGVNHITNPEQTHSVPPGKQSTATNDGPGEAPPLPARHEGRRTVNEVGAPSQMQDDKVDPSPGQGTIGTSVV